MTKTIATLRRAAGYYTVRELAQALEINEKSLYCWIQREKVAAPRRTWGNSKRKYYSADDIRQIKAQFETESEVVK